jgi:uncharacterized protein YecE (DUF72 family)
MYPLKPRIRIGTSGFSYQDWKGVFYPERFSQAHMLSFYSTYFSVIEINATFYHIPPPKNMEAMIKKSEGRIEFIIKAHQDLTHNKDKAVDALPYFRKALAPMNEAGVLACLLLQFPYSYKNIEDNRLFLLKLKERLNPYPVVVEFRNRGWITHEIFRYLRENDIGYCSVDEPHYKNLPPPIVAATSPIGYIRFHGRNYANWWNHKEAWERYDYEYTEEELKEWVVKVRDLASKTDKVYILFNNHPRGQSVRNAMMMQRLLGLES